MTESALFGQISTAMTTVWSVLVLHLLLVAVRRSRGFNDYYTPCCPLGTENSSCTIGSGDSVILACRNYKTNPGDKCTWHKGGEVLQNKTSCTWTLEGSQWAGGRYECYEDGVEYSVNVTISDNVVANFCDPHFNCNYPPPVKCHSISQTIDFNERVDWKWNISCRVHGTPIPNVTWTFNSEPLNSNYTIIQPNTSRVSTVVFENILDYHMFNGDYVCEAGDVSALQYVYFDDERTKPPTNCSPNNQDLSVNVNQTLRLLFAAFQYGNDYLRYLNICYWANHSFPLSKECCQSGRGGAPGICNNNRRWSLDQLQSQGCEGGGVGVNLMVENFAENDTGWYQAFVSTDTFKLYGYLPLGEPIHIRATKPTARTSGGSGCTTICYVSLTCAGVVLAVVVALFVPTFVYCSRRRRRRREEKQDGGSVGRRIPRHRVYGSTNGCADYRQTIQHSNFSLTVSSSVAEDGTHLRNIYVSCTEEKEQWVMDTLMPVLRSRGYKVVMYNTQAIGGKIALEERVRLIEQCDGVVIVLSPDYKDKSETQFELHRALQRQKSERRPVIPVVCGSSEAAVPVPLGLEHKVVVNADLEDFVEKLLQALDNN